MSEHPSWACTPCGFVGPGLVPFSAEWYRQHRVAHLAAFPDVDQGTRDNLAMFIDRAETVATDCPHCGCPVLDGEEHAPVKPKICKVGVRHE